MRISSGMVSIFSFIWLSFLVSCVSEGVTTPTVSVSLHTNTQTTETATSTVIETEETGTATTGEPNCGDGPATAQIHGEVIDDAGTPLAGLVVKVCHEGCLSHTTDKAGRYEFAGLRECDYAVYVEVEAQVSPLTVISLQEEQVLEMPITALSPDNTVDWPKSIAEVELAQGWFVTVDQESVVDSASLAPLKGVVVPLVQSLPMDLPGEVIAVAYLDPVTASLTEGAPLRVENSFGLEPCDTLEVWTASVVEAAWVLAGELYVSGDNLVGGAKIPSLSTTVLLLPSDKASGLKSPKAATSTLNCKDAPETATLSGEVVDEFGVPVEGAMIIICNEVCRYLSADALGQFLFENVQACPQAVEVSGGDKYATPLTILDFTDGQVRDVKLTLIEHAGFTVLESPAIEVELAPNLLATVGLGDIETSWGGDLDEVAGASAEPVHYLPTDLSGDLKAMFHLEPFDAVPMSPIAISVRDEYGIGECNTVEVWTASYDDVAWLYGGTLRSQSGLLVGDATLSVLSTTVLVMPSSK